MNREIVKDAIDQVVHLRAAAALVEFVRQSGTFKRRLQHWATVCIFTLSSIVSLILLSATGVVQSGLQEDIVGMTLT